jgi:hypothetical protein
MNLVWRNILLLGDPVWVLTIAGAVLEKLSYNPGTEITGLPRSGLYIAVHRK